LKIKLIYPTEKSRAGYFESRRGIWYPLLTFPVLAGYTPAGVDEIEIIDEEFEAIDFDDPVDLVGITVMTHLSHRAYEIAQSYRERGIKVVMGGMHVSALPDEASRHADAVVIGEGEDVWPVLVKDFLKNQLKPVYKAPALFDTQNYRPARLDLLKKYSDPAVSKRTYTSIAIFEVSRGCPFDCDFCAVTNFYGKKYRFRDLKKLIEDVRNFKLSFRTRLIGFVDDNLYGSKEYFKQFLKEVSKLNVYWSGQISVNIGDEPDLIKMMADSGCKGVFVGFESLSPEGLKAVNKKINIVDRYHRLIDLFAENHILVFPAIIFGLDGEPPDIFEVTKKFLQDHQQAIGFTTFSVITPLPGTRLYDRMLAENRIIQHDWKYYNFNYVTIKPLSMPAEELQQRYDEFMDQYEHEMVSGAVLNAIGRNVPYANNNF